MPIEKYKTADVFTPATPASLSFVPRVSVDAQLKRALQTPGKQIVVFGHSGSGKTTLITNAISVASLGSITSRCTKESTFESIVLSAFDKLNPFYAAENTKKDSSSSTAKLEGAYHVIKASVERAATSESSEKSTRALPPQLTAERLAEFCGAAGCCWIVEDFHKVAASEKEKLAQSMKVFMDTAADFPLVRVIAIGAVDTAREVVQYDPEMNTRVAEIAVPILSQEELVEILSKGEQLLNVRFGALKQQIAAYASGLGAVCHQIALNICLAAGIEETSNSEIWISTLNLENALKGYVADSSDTLKAAFDKAIKNKRERKFDNTRLILKALNECGRRRRVIRRFAPKYPARNTRVSTGKFDSLLERTRN
jgi:energy-coupling factor transporter ATP-binding protein EcfA2